MKNKKIALMYILSFLAMFSISYTTLYTFDHFTFSLNKLYMALLMTSSMGIINTLVMSDMYKDRKLKFGILGISVVIAIASFTFIRTQSFIGDNEFLTSMIPHHSAAILVCEKATILEPENQELCKEIIEAQRREIEIMQGRLDGK